MSRFFTYPLDATKTMSQRWTGRRDKYTEADHLATICVAHLPDKIKKAIHSYGTEGDYGAGTTPMFVRIIFKNGHKVDFRADWKEFAAECILVYDLSPVEIDDGQDEV